MGNKLVKNNIELNRPADDLSWKLRIFDCLPYPSVIVSSDKTLVGANKKFYETFNLSLKEIYGNKCFQIFLYKNTPCNSDNARLPKYSKTGKSIVLN